VSIGVAPRSTCTANLAEFDFRYDGRTKLCVSEIARRENVLKDIEGKRLTYRRTDEADDA
jgi:hypothetical protein